MSQHEAVAVQKQSTSQASGILQRKCSGCRKKKAKGILQRRAVRDDLVMDVPPIVHEVLRTPGRPLDRETRTFMEPRFRYDFSRVRLHTDAKASDSADAVNARAYTVGRDVVFGAGQYAPETGAGQVLMAHELAHVVQQEGKQGNSMDLVFDSPWDQIEHSARQLADHVISNENAPSVLSSGLRVQRDLATPLPSTAPGAQIDLTEARVREALQYNRSRYDAANTRIIQEILGGPVTGTWTRENIIAIAETQEQYGLEKDGKVGPDTFRFIVREQEREGTNTPDENCLTMFRVVVLPLVQRSATPGPGGTTRITGHHIVEAQFSSRCDCSRFQYRQEIRGVATATRGLLSSDRSGGFSNIPGGWLPRNFREDGMTQCAGPRYGHRELPMQERTTLSCGENRYINEAGVTDPAGCTYRGEDFPDIETTGLNSGVALHFRAQFRGRIERDGREVQTKSWTTVDETVTTP